MFDSSLVLFALAPNVFIAGVSMVILGMAFSGWMISVSVLLQVTASEEMRGRVMSLYFMTVLTYQFGWLIGGAGIEAWGVETTLFLGIAGGVLLAGTAIIMTPELRRAR